MKAFIPIASAVIGGLIGFITAYRIAFRKEMYDAGCDLISAFFPCIVALSDKFSDGAEANTVKEDYYSVIVNTFPEQAQAALRFRGYLIWWRRRGFDRAWANYCGYNYKDKSAPNKLFLSQYSDEVLDGKKADHVAIERIKQILCFVKTGRCKFHI